jgi:hypothetical protein
MDDPAPQYIPREHQRTFERYLALVRLFDDAIGIPGTRLRFGLDFLLGLIPGAGDVAGAMAALWGVWLARRMGAPVAVQIRMLGNVALDAAGGAIPILGDLFDLAFRAHVRNRVLLERWLAAPQRVGRSSRIGLLLAILGVLAVLALTVTLAIAVLGALMNLLTAAI